jgi:hypothetical protein
MQETSVTASGKQSFDFQHMQALLAICFHAGFLLFLLFNPEDGGAIFFRSVG